MIALLSGVMGGFIETDEVIIDVAGVGYAITVSPRTAGELGGLGSSVTLYIYTHVREDAITLFGFSSLQERRLFATVLSAHGVGPTLALTLTGTLSPEALAAAVVSDDADLLCTVPGIGKKTAARLLLDLKGKLGGAIAPSASSSGTPGTVRAQIRAALSDLGFTADEVAAALEEVDDGASVESGLRVALMNIGAS